MRFGNSPTLTHTTTKFGSTRFRVYLITYMHARGGGAQSW